MVSYKCDRCNKIFTHKNDYRRHINRKNSCSKITQKLLKKNKLFECSMCHKTYSRKFNLNRHITQFCKARNNTQFMSKIKMDIQEDTHDVVYEDQNISISSDCDGQENILHTKTHKTHKNAQNKSIHTCEYCSKMFTRQDTLTRHKNKYCKVRKENEEDMKKLLNRLVKQMEEQKTQMKDLKQTNNTIIKENKKLQKDVKNIKGNTTNSHNNSHNTSNVQNNINLLSFGKDNTEGISNEEIKAILKRGFSSIKLMTKKTNFDPNIPENHNVYINNIKSPYAVTYNKGRWKIDKTEDVIDRIYDDKYGFLEQKYHELKAELTPYERKKIERILDQYEGVKIIKIFDEIRLILYNNRHIPLRTRNIMGN
uniref:C2H2-type domain-containing protein n=1 Tax=Mimivirus LCMiAC02 TaxID=2506609 RepID=A0A481Z1R2_9VIRU|nr:MAG: uncharacterized protein LCMiAC02_00880 [Mimivirus LCMiAC02]